MSFRRLEEGLAHVLNRACSDCLVVVSVHGYACVPFSVAGYACVPRFSSLGKYWNVLRGSHINDVFRCAYLLRLYWDAQAPGIPLLRNQG